MEYMEECLECIPRSTLLKSAGSASASCSASVSVSFLPSEGMHPSHVSYKAYTGGEMSAPEAQSKAGIASKVTMYCANYTFVTSQGLSWHGYTRTENRAKFSARRCKGRSSEDARTKAREMRGQTMQVGHLLVRVRKLTTRLHQGCIRGW